MSSSTQRVCVTIVSLITCLCLAYTAGFGTYSLWDKLKQTSQPKPLPVFWEAWDRIEQYFYGEVPSPQERTYGAIHATLELLGDPYTVFVEPQPRELERDRLRGSFGGVGVTLWRDATGQMVLYPHPDSPAEREGILEGDVLLAVDHQVIYTDTTTVDDVRAWLHGEVGTTVTLTISRPPTPPFDLVIARDEIQVPSVTWLVLDRAPDIGYVRVESFTERTNDEIASALQELLREADPISGLILDLRSNFGGLIEPAVSVASQFLSDGVVLYEEYRGDRRRTFPVRDGGIATDIPLVVLVNGQTASASEIVAGALQDHERAPLIGESTFGKGVVQQIYDLSDGSCLHVTSAIWLTPNQHRITGEGLSPDIYVPQGDGSQDEQLERAVAYLQSRVKE